MDRTASIVLGRPAAPLPPEAKARPPATRYWHYSATVLSALLTLMSVLLHVALYEALRLADPVSPPPASEPIPVELVPPPPPPEPKPEEEKAKEKEKPETPAKAEQPKKAELPKTPGPPDAKTQPDPPPPASPPPLPAAKTAPPPPPAPQPPPANAAPARPLLSPPAIEQPPPPPVPEVSLLPVSPPVPEAAAPKGPAEGLKVDADAAPPPPGERRALGYWVLEPLTLNLGGRCGLARITGVLELRERVAGGRFRGTIHTQIAWAKCPAEGALHAVELRINGGVVTMIGANGSVDRGVISANLMLLEDAYGRSVWKKR